MAIESVTKTSTSWDSASAVDTSRHRTFRTIETIRPIGGDQPISPGAVGTIIGGTGDDIEIALYSPRDMVVFTDASRIRTR